MACEKDDHSSIAVCGINERQILFKDVLLGRGFVREQCNVF
jgi:hypothetical protein